MHQKYLHKVILSMVSELILWKFYEPGAIGSNMAGTKNVLSSSTQQYLPSYQYCGMYSGLNYLKVWWGKEGIRKWAKNGGKVLSPKFPKHDTTVVIWIGPKVLGVNDQEWPKFGVNKQKAKRHWCRLFGLNVGLSLEREKTRKRWWELHTLQEQ